MTPLLWCILILLLGLALIFLEIFIPSAGVLSVLAAVAVLTSVITAYVYCGPGTGTLFLLGSVIVVPAAVGLALLWYTHTPVGRLLIGKSQTKAEGTNRQSRHAAIAGWPCEDRQHVLRCPQRRRSD